jgi:hypothetical protein
MRADGTTADYIVGYMSRDMRHVTSFGGEILGSARIVSTWKLPLACWISDRMYQVEVVVNGRTYTGRTGGASMIYRGRRKRR